jgi:hypothetical protein
MWLVPFWELKGRPVALVNKRRWPSIQCTPVKLSDGYSQICYLCLSCRSSVGSSGEHLGSWDEHVEKCTIKWVYSVENECCSILCWYMSHWGTRLPFLIPKLCQKGTGGSDNYLYTLPFHFSNILLSYVTNLGSAVQQWLPLQYHCVIPKFSWCTCTPSNTTCQLLIRTHYIGDMFRLIL